MKKIFAMSIAMLTGSIGSNAYAQGWSFLPVLKDDFVAAPALSATAGVGSVRGTSAAAYGVELAFNCVLLQPPSNLLRQHLSYMFYEEGGFSLHSAEINPHYTIEVAKGVSVGAGPGIGLVYIDADDRNTTLGAAQLGASAYYTGIENMLIGLESRYQFTTTRYYDRDNKRYDNANNWRAALSVGYRF